MLVSFSFCIFIKSRYHQRDSHLQVAFVVKGYPKLYRIEISKSAQFVFEREIKEHLKSFLSSAWLKALCKKAIAETRKVSNYEYCLQASIITDK